MYRMGFFSLFSLVFATGCEGFAYETRAGEPGPEGVPGPQGAPGARGPRGLPGESVERSREEISAHSLPLAAGDKGTMIRASAVCSEGARIVTGGCLWFADGPDAIGSVAPYASRPVVEGDGPELAQGWICEAKDLEGTGRIHAWAVCELDPSAP